MSRAWSVTMFSTDNRLICAVIACLLLLGTPAAAWAQSARTRYESALAREPQVRSLIESTSREASSTNRARVEREVRRLIAAYEAIVNRYPTSGYSDNALWQAAELNRAMFERQGLESNRQAALRLYRRLIQEYPSSSLIARAAPQVARLETSRTSGPRPAASIAPATAPARHAAPPAPEPPAPPPAALPQEDERRGSSRATLMSIDRAVMPEVVRITLTLDHEVPYRQERIDGPERLFFDLRGVGLPPALLDRTLEYADDVVRQIRLGRHPNDTVRVVLDAEGVTRHSVFTLYNPFRLVVDCERASGARAASLTTPTPPGGPQVREAEAAGPSETGGAPASPPSAMPAPASASPPVPSRDTIPEPTAPPAPPAANAAGGFSMARQLGLGVSRIVIDPGHGGRDPGARVKGLNEADLTLDVALKLEKLLQREPGIEVVLTRRTDVYVPLEERTAVANRESADLFLSIHANASRNTAARGIETYYLSFASTPEAEAVAARENAGSDGAMRNLPDIIRAIALNNKLDESRDFAAMVQQSLVSRLRRVNSGVRDLGVKKAPFVVLIGASMPSVLAEVSFLTHRQDAQLLKTGTYRQRIAEALHGAVLRYRRALKGESLVAEQ